MKLTIGERMVMAGLLPKEANFSTLKVVRAALDALAPTEGELKLLKIETIRDAGYTVWDVKAEEQYGEQEIPLSEMALDMVKEELTRLNSVTPPKLSLQHMSLYEKLIGK